MIGLRQLSNNRLELYASHFPLETLAPYLLDFYREAYATVVLYEDNYEVFHETGIFSFDASEPETFNYEEFRAPLIEEFNDKLAVCTVENLFLHFRRTMEEKPLEDDPFQNLVFSISLAPPSRDLLLDWERNLDNRLSRVLYDEQSSDHFQLFPYEACVVYSHDNHYTSITSDKEDLIVSIFEDIVERHLAPLTQPPLPRQVINDLYDQLKTYHTIRLKPDRVHNDETGQPFLLVTYPKSSKGFKKRVSRLALTPQGFPLSVGAPEFISRLKYHLRYSDLSFLPMILITLLMSSAIVFAVLLKNVFHLSPTLGHLPGH